MVLCFRGLKCSQGKEEAIIDLETHTALHAHNNSGTRRNGERMFIRIPASGSLTSVDGGAFLVARPVKSLSGWQR